MRKSKPYIILFCNLGQTQPFYTHTHEQILNTTAVFTVTVIKAALIDIFPHRGCMTHMINWEVALTAPTPTEIYHPPLWLLSAPWGFLAYSSKLFMFCTLWPSFFPALILSQIPQFTAAAGSHLQRESFDKPTKHDLPRHPDMRAARD